MTTTPTDRWRCCVTGCNPALFGESDANRHRDASGHRVAKGLSDHQKASARPSCETRLATTTSTTSDTRHQSVEDLAATRTTMLTHSAPKR